MNQNDRTLATVSHGVSAVGLALSGGMLGWLVPLIIFFVKRKESRFVAFHALQSVFLHAALSILGIAGLILTVMTLGLAGAIVGPLMLVLGIAAVAVEIFAAMRANSGKWYGIPVVGEWTRKSLGDP